MLSQAFLYLLFAVITVPIARKFKLGSILGYLIAGILIGPVFGLVGSEVSSVQHFAEFGVVMMMFLIGLELEPKEIWQMRYQLIGLGGMQILLTSALLVAIAIWLFGFAWNQAIALSLILSLSSTAIVLQSLQESKRLGTKAGQSALSVLITQDIAVIPFFAILPLLVIDQSRQALNHVDDNMITHLPGLLQAIIIFSVILSMIIIGKLLLRHVFRYIAKTKSIEIFTALALLLIIGITIVMNKIGLSAALGTFIAGVILSDSEYRHEIESQISPFKGLLMGIFFIAIGASINFTLFISNWTYILAWVGMILSSKLVVLMALARIYKLKGADFWLFSLSLTQSGEFAFVLLTLAFSLSLLAEHTVNIIVLVVIITMLITPLLFLLYEKVLIPLYQQHNNAKADQVTHHSEVVIAGTGRFGQIIARVLNANDYDPVILDYNIDMIDTFRKYGNTSYFGNVLSPGVLESAGVQDAKVFIAALGNKDNQTTLVSMLKRHNKDLLIIARAKDRHHVYELEEAGADFVIRETFESASLAALEALTMLGDSKKQAQKKVDLFKSHDQASLKKLKALWLKSGEDKHYVSQATADKDALSELMSQEK